MARNEAYCYCKSPTKCGSCIVRAEMLDAIQEFCMIIPNGVECTECEFFWTCGRIDMDTKFEWSDRYERGEESN